MINTVNKKDRYDDFEDYGEINCNGSIAFSTSDIETIHKIAGELAEITAKNEDVEFVFDISAVPDGENDYNFAVLKINVIGESANTSICRF